MILKGSEKIFAALAGKKVLVVGLGRTGLSAARFLRKNGALVAATDVQPASALRGISELEAMGVIVEAGGHRKESFLGADMIVVSPGVEGGMPLLKDAETRGIEVISDIELVYRFLDAPVFAVTGTNGKSTVTALLSEVLKNAGKKAFTGGNIGVPATEYFEGGEDYDACVLEISSFHLERIKSFRPRVAVLLNITEDHLYRHGGINEYAEVKFRIFANQTPGDYAVVNVGDPVIKGMIDKGGLIKCNIIPFSTAGRMTGEGGWLKEGLYLDGGSIMWASAGKEEVYPAEGMHLAGVHNTENIMAVIAASRVAGVKREVVCDTVRNFRGLPHRMEFVREKGGVRYINDSKSTNVGSLCKALIGMREGVKDKKTVILIAGGKDKGGDYGVLKEAVREKVKLLILMGEAKERLKEALSGSTETVEAAGMEEAVRLSALSARPGDTVLFSPACSSFDMFRDFEERGMTFRRLVEGLK
ncbi:MAG: UDP-N-acetylmuramoyl-L-alanine--D-glutamate ligase [Deltaproteobacteria bacterium]|nr:UDP-N-acetylmuramoyl-L-alanine--D-glutamate ligase [Deltaproteobacteria bacterium]